jgi:hypothetical protein
VEAAKRVLRVGEAGGGAVDAAAEETRNKRARKEKKGLNDVTSTLG